MNAVLPQGRLKGLFYQTSSQPSFVDRGDHFEATTSELCCTRPAQARESNVLRVASRRNRVNAGNTPCEFSDASRSVADSEAQFQFQFQFQRKRTCDCAFLMSAHQAAGSSEDLGPRTRFPLARGGGHGSPERITSWQHVSLIPLL
jgi:hypothetical protein